LGNALNLSLFPPDFNVGQNGELQDRDVGNYTRVILPW